VGREAKKASLAAGRRHHICNHRMCATVSKPLILSLEEDNLRHSLMVAWLSNPCYGAMTGMLCVK